MPEAIQETEIKGVALRNFPLVLAAIRGEAAARRTLDTVSPALRDALLRGEIVSGGWYPIDWYRSLHAAARREAPDEARLAWLIGRESTKRDLSGIYRVFLRVLSPTVVLSAASRLFGTYYRHGRMRIVDSRPGFGRVELSDCHGFDHNVFSDVLGGCEVTLELAGAKLVRVRCESGGQNGDARATAVAWWSDAGAEVADEPPPK